ncbi:MAG: clostripain-related cysteine peptidase [Clostridium sp.]|nr:clostripain-related cysteine peptidase [Clostridium sp.]
MLKKYTSLILLCSLALCACDKDSAVPAPSQTVIVYMAAENSLNAYSRFDIEEMEAGAAQLPEGQQLAVFLDNVNKPCIYKMDRNGTTTVRKYEEDFCSTDSACMERVLTDIFSSFQSRKYGLVLWSHGSGWAPATRSASPKLPQSFGIDNERNTTSNAGKEMNITTLSRILSHHPHTEFILFDACLMQSIEVAYELRNVTDYIIGSPAETPGPGAPYNRVVPAMFASTGNMAEQIVNSYFSSYENNYGMLISAIRTDKLEPLAEITRQHLVPLCGNRTELPTDGVQAYYAFHRATGYKPEFFDMNGVMYKHLSPVVYDAWHEALNEAVPYRKATSTWLTSYSGAVNNRINDLSLYGGITLFIPNEKYTQPDLNAALHAYQWYRAAGWDITGW